MKIVWSFCRFALGCRIGLVVGLIAFVLPFTVANAQFSQPRFELTYEHGDEAFTIISLKEDGMSMIRQKVKPDGYKKLWELTLLDTALVQTWSTVIPLHHEFIMVGYEYVPGELFYLFRKGESSQGDLRLVRIYLYSHVIQEYDITPKLDFSLSHFTIVGNSAILGGYVARQSTAFLFEMGKNHIKVIPGFFTDNTELLEIKANRNKTFNILQVERGLREKKLLTLKTFDETGSLLMEDDIELEGNKTILSGTTSTLENDELFLAGTWGPGMTKKSVGFFSVLVDPFNKQPIHYYEFGELQHFFDYLEPRRASKLKSRAEKRRHEQKSPFYRCDVHVVKVEETSKGFLLLAELYVPLINSNYPPYYSNNPYYASNPYYNPYGINPMMSGRNYSSPYATPYGNSMPSYGPGSRNLDITMLHSSLVIFDRHGKLKEDFGLAMPELRLPNLEQASDFYASEKFVQFYKKDGEILSATSWEGGNALEQDTVKINLRSREDALRNESGEQGGVRLWYRNYAYVWGFETIKNKTEQSGSQVRYVYYVNKIRLD